MRLGEARTPDGMRLYAVGDVHGCDSLLAEVHERIADDLAGAPVGQHRLIHIGDYVDRGPDSAGVVTRLLALKEHDPSAVFLKGNHDQLLMDFLADPDSAGEFYLSANMGGPTTLRSYGVPLAPFDLRTDTTIAKALAAAMPDTHHAFFRDLAVSARFGDYFFCHAGVRPGVPLDRQSSDDLVWIRDEFLLDGSDHGAVIVHGHTVSATMRPEVLPNRINIDTGAVFDGPLTCVVLEGTDVRFLEG